MSIRDELIEAIKSEIQYLYLEGKSGPKEYSDSALATLEQFLTAHGLQIVSKEHITDEMIGIGRGRMTYERACIYTGKTPIEADQIGAKGIYLDMLLKAPNPLAEADGEDE